MAAFQRTNILVLIALQLIGSIFSLILFSVQGREQQLLLGLYLAIPVLMVLFGLYWRFNWRWAPHLNVLAATLITSFLLIDPSHPGASTVFFLPAALAFVMLNSSWTLVVGGLTLGLVLVQSLPGSHYRLIDQLIAYLIVIGCLFFGRRTIERSQHHVAQMLHSTEATNRELQQLANTTEAQAEQLAQQNQEQRQLLERVSTLELPHIRIGPQTMLVPLIGHLNSQRMHSITQRLLHTVTQQSLRRIVLDISEVQAIHSALTSELLKLIQALQLVGVQVMLSGIKPDTALLLASEHARLRQIRIVQSPYELIQELNQARVQVEQP